MNRFGPLLPQAEVCKNQPFLAYSLALPHAHFSHLKLFARIHRAAIEPNFRLITLLQLIQDAVAQDHPVNLTA